MNTKYLIATNTKPNDQKGFEAFCGILRSSAEEHGKLKLVGGITWVPGPGCNNLAFEIEGKDKDAEFFINQVTMMLMPAKWGTTSDTIAAEDTWVPYES